MELRRLPERGHRRDRLRLPGRRPLRRHRAATRSRSGCWRRQHHARRGGRPALCRRVLPAGGQGADHRPGRESDRRLPRAPRSQRPGCPTRPRPRRWRSSNARRQGRLPGRLAHLRGGRDRGFLRDVGPRAPQRRVPAHAGPGRPAGRPEEWCARRRTVNAFYDPSNNEIIFPAAILQPPFFDYQADPASNFGGDRLRDRPRDHPRLRPAGLPVRRRRQPAPTGGPMPTTPPSRR